MPLQHRAAFSPHTHPTSATESFHFYNVIGQREAWVHQLILPDSIAADTLMHQADIIVDTACLVPTQALFQVCLKGLRGWSCCGNGVWMFEVWRGCVMCVGMIVEGKKSENAGLMLV